MAGLQSGEGRTMIDSVVWAQYINVTDRHTDSHVATANATALGGKNARSISHPPHLKRVAALPWEVRIFPNQPL